MENETIPLVISLIFILILTLCVIALGYHHGNMHLLTTLKNAAH